MNHLRNFARIVRRYFSTLRPVKIPGKNSYMLDNLDSSNKSLVNECYKLAKAMCDKHKAALGVQHSLLKQLVKNECIDPNSWAILGFNKICIDKGKEDLIIDVKQPPTDVNEERVKDESIATFLYMINDWKMPNRFWMPDYEKELNKESFKNSEIKKIYEAVKANPNPKIRFS